GAHFPDTDTAYLNADSGILLSKVWKLAQDKGYQLGNLDATVICESPRLSPHIQEMRQHIADILHSPIQRISIKATSEEGLGISGSGGLAAHCVILLEKQG
ncbi:MAG: 2-C-methyl-D-erythritol 2,4-cyclodiphosphate synthase, partial [Candidatus Cloacimonetes bacterium]|nr:2-C-methyl-D-erythritol 2,4-cyclodiphosphate synthase [Candidatus Cloacimonadota bacterium]